MLASCHDHKVEIRGNLIALVHDHLLDSALKRIIVVQATAISNRRELAIKVVHDDARLEDPSFSVAILAAM